MILTIDTTAREEIKIGLDEKIATINTTSHSENILSDIDAMLTKNQKTLQDITAILVNNVAGSYTGVRIGVTIANTLAWSLDIPVFGFHPNNLANTMETNELSTGGFRGLVLPEYGTTDK